ncbi:MAG: M23 family metallopeptidase [Eubacteriaceae bacterium]|nr:M23 family metallopeptidase [Eubacteriaceae bacterium]
MSYGRNELRIRKDTGSRRSYQVGSSRSSGGGDRSLTNAVICVCILLAVFGLKSSSAKLAQRAVETLTGLVRYEADFSESADSVVSFFTNAVYSLTGKELPVNAPAPTRLYPPIEDGKLYRGFIDDVHPVFNLVVKPVGIIIEGSPSGNVSCSGNSRVFAIIRNGDGTLRLVTVYNNSTKIVYDNLAAVFVKEGDSLSDNQIIGILREDSPILGFEVWVNNEAVDPFGLLGEAY